MAAVEAFQAGDMVEDDDPVARREIPHSGPGRGHYARRLMPVDSWRRQQVIFDFLEVGMADPTALDANQELSQPDLRRWDVLHRYRAAAGVDRGPHTGRGGR